MFENDKYSYALLIQRLSSVALCGVSSKMYLKYQQSFHHWFISTTLVPNPNGGYDLDNFSIDKWIALCEQNPGPCKFSPEKRKAKYVF